MSLSSPGKFARDSANGLLNIGSGKDLTIAEAARLVTRVMGFEGDLAFDTTKPDGTPQKLLDVSRANSLGWKATVDLADGIRMAYRDYLSRLAN
jgi:GDP-L-fucose synthase